MSPTRRLVSDALLTIGPKIAGGALTLAIGLVLAARLPAEAYAPYALALAALMLADAVVGTPFDLAVLRLTRADPPGPEAPQTAAERAALGLKLALAAAAALAALGLVGVTGAGAAAAGQVALVAAAAAAGLALRSVLVGVQLRQRFAAYAGVEVAQLALRLGPALAAALVLPPDVAVIGTLAVLAGGAALVLAGVAVLAPHRVPRPALAAPALGAVAGLVRWYLPTMALGAALARADLVLLGLLAGPAEAGRFGAAQAIAAVPDLVGMYLGVALTPRVLALAREGRLRPFFRRAQAVLTGLALAGLGVAWGLAGWAADLPGGIAAAAPVALILLPGTALAFTTSALSLPLVMVARERWLLRVDLAVAPVALFAWAGVIGTGGGAVGAAWVTVAVMVARSLAVLAMAWHLSARAQGFAAQG